MAFSFASKLDNGVPQRMVSCHTALVDGYVIEGTCARRRHPSPARGASRCGRAWQCQECPMVRQAWALKRTARPTMSTLIHEVMVRPRSFRVTRKDERVQDGTHVPEPYAAHSSR